MKRPLLSREDVTYWICRFRTLDVTKLEERRRLIDSFVNSVTIFLSLCRISALKVLLCLQYQGQKGYKM